MDLRTCEKCGSSADVAACSWCSATVATALSEQNTVTFTTSATDATVVLGGDDSKTVQLALPAAAQPLVVPRQRAVAAEPGLLAASYNPASDNLETAEFPHVPIPRQSVGSIAPPQLPTPVSAEELAVERLRLADDDDTDPHLVRILTIFFLALAIAVGAGYLMATSLSSDIQAFFNSIMRG
jgi:hypothetical protein